MNLKLSFIIKKLMSNIDSGKSEVDDLVKLKEMEISCFFVFFPVTWQVVKKQSLK
jgi:hypothetical protein